MQTGTMPIRAAVLRAPGAPLRLERLQLEMPREDEILVRIVASGVCHTDIDFRSSLSGPAVLGHEGAGVVEAVGRKVKRFLPGDHVVLSYQSCGRCRKCRAGRPADCERFYDVNFGFCRADGSNAYSGGVHGHFFGQSSFATHTLATERNTVKVRKDLPLEILAPLGCGFQTGAGTVMNSLAVKARSSIVIFGTGSVGLAAIMAARLVKAQTIIAVDKRTNRLKLALEVGANWALDSRKLDVEDEIRCVHLKGVDYALDTTGDPEIQETAISILKPGGTLATLTGEPARKLPRGCRMISVIQGDAVPQRFIPKLIRHYEKGQFPMDRLLRFYPFSKINRAMSDSMRGTAIKPVLLFD